MVEFDALVHVIDDDEAVRESLRWLIESVDLKVKTYSSALEFLENIDETTASCIVTDVRMPGISGLDLQRELQNRHIQIPIIFITGHADVPMAVRAMKDGAIDFIEKPFNDQDLLERVQRALLLSQNQRHQSEDLQSIQKNLNSLTARERQVMELVVQGLSSKKIAEQLGISAKTIEVHRAKVMEKMKADSVASLVRMVVTETYHSADKSV